MEGSLSISNAGAQDMCARHGGRKDRKNVAESDLWLWLSNLSNHTHNLEMPPGISTSRAAPDVPGSMGH